VGVRLIYRVFALSIFVLTVRAEIFFFYIRIIGLQMDWFSSASCAYRCTVWKGCFWSKV